MAFREVTLQEVKEVVRLWRARVPKRRIAAQLGLTFFGFSTITVFAALVVYFGGFNFLEASMPSLVANIHFQSSAA